jgi:hypothetical protein
MFFVNRRGTAHDHFGNLIVGDVAHEIKIVSSLI